MPELPEVETVRRGLSPVFDGAMIRKVTLNRGDLRFPLPADFCDRLGGRRMIALGRRAKYLLGDLEDGTVLVMHLGMSGSFRIEEVGEACAQPVAAEAFHYPRSVDRAHDHVIFHLEHGGTQRLRIVYNDPRRFGFMSLVARAEIERHPWFAALGPEPTGNALDADHLAKVAAGRATPLKALLLDQRAIAGLGNIYVCEALHRAKLSPLRSAGTLATAAGAPTAGAKRLVEAIREVIAEAIVAGGSTLRDHRQADGELGYFQHSFAVYGREGEPCPRPTCGGTVERIVQSGRSTFHCPRCQR
ncbi:bifunctional DNA-formamidopyrimidine glycosylase/DNA-(apurinic or apyrimidinic site) lyase [Stappia sp. WLB 29]|uniref:bifunctional DNA-formamidopyrimidine glycosylase/DNA-(apurinic or apyrimidinic site) lyase n=1 Tax=Stappia sp. WLB 29 TaxID=2925220 RepID=UPI00209AA12D|nr:bifunctional DNA-formamidopyrimidine glycosylase/DNA-(apurinic or apyrimidinic site) lyase [Stappia sp. WLB 29]